MTTTISTMDIRHNLGDYLNKVAIRCDEYIIERKGKPLAAMIPIKKLRTMEKAAKIQIADILDHEDADISDLDLDKLSNEAKHYSRG